VAPLWPQGCAGEPLVTNGSSCRMLVCGPSVRPTPGICLNNIPQIAVADSQVCAPPVQQASADASEAAPSARRTDLSNFATGVWPECGPVSLIMDASPLPGCAHRRPLMPVAHASMPIRQGSIVAKNGSTRDRLRRRRTITPPSRSTPCTWKRTLLCPTRQPQPVRRSPPRSSVAAHAAPSVESRPRHQQRTCRIASGGRSFHGDG